MNVHNLIDLQLDLSLWSDQDPARRPPSAPSEDFSPAPQLPEQKPLDTANLLTLPSRRPSLGEDPTVPAPVVASLLGPDVATYPMNESTFREALRMRAEQDKLRQEQTRLEIASRNLAIMELAARQDLPPHLIPYMVVGDASDPRYMVPPQQSGPQQPILAPQSLKTYPIPLIPSYGAPRQSPTLRPYDQFDNVSTVPPLNYQFGLGAKFPPKSPHISHSPAKFGAAATPNAANPVTPYRQTYRTHPTHQRHFSMLSDPSVPVARYADRKKLKNPHLSRLKSPQGASSAMHIKPSPAQPLNKQIKHKKTSSQNSMTSFQHMIQFHHWKPQNPDDSPLSDNTSGPAT